FLDIELGDVNVERLAQGVEDVAFDDIANGHGDWSAGVNNFLTAYETIGGLHSDRTDHVFAQVLSGFEGNRGGFAVQCQLNGQRVVNFRHRICWEFSVDDRTGNAGDTAHGAGGSTGTGFVNGGSHVTHFYVDVEIWVSEAVVSPLGLGQCVCTGDEFGELLSNGSLSGVVHQQGVLTDEVFGVLTG